MPQTKRVTLIRGADYEMFEGCTLDAALEAIKNLKSDSRIAGHTNIRFETEGREYEEGYQLNVIGDRPETQAEIDYRAEEARRQEMWDRDQLARLKAKYPD